MSQNWTSDQLADYTRRRLKQKQNETNPNLGGLQNPKHQHDPAPALARGRKRVKSNGTSMAFRVSIISVRHRLLDGDNFIAGSKWLRDQIAETIGLDDSEGSGITWYYHQHISRGKEGTIVTIERL